MRLRRLDLIVLAATALLSVACSEPPEARSDLDGAPAGSAPAPAGASTTPSTTGLPTPPTTAATTLPPAGNDASVGIGPAFDVDLGGASSVEVIPFESAHEMANVVDVEFLAEEIPLTACRMLYPGYLVYDIEIPNDIFDYPLDLVFIPYSLIDDIGLPMGAALVTVERPGPATIPIPLRTVFHSPVRSTVAVDEDDVSDFLGQCQSHIVALDESGRGNDFATYLDYEDDPVAVAAFSPLGTYQRLAEEAEWWDLDAPFRVLAYVHGVHGDLFADEIALITSGDRLRWLRERYEAGCYSITTSYESGHVLVQQQSGCEPEPNTTLLQERGQWSLWGYSENPDEISWFANASPRPPEELAPLDR